MPREELDKTSKKELDKTSKEGTIETSDEDEIQVDSGGNQGQAIDQEELNPQDDNVIGPQALSAQAPSAQAPSVQAPSAQAPSPQAPPMQAPSAQAPSAQAPSVQAPSVQAPPAQAPLASPSSLTKAKEPWQPSLYKPPQPAQQHPPAQYLHPGTANTNPAIYLPIYSKEAATIAISL